MSQEVVGEKGRRRRRALALGGVLVSLFALTALDLVVRRGDSGLNELHYWNDSGADLSDGPGVALDASLVREAVRTSCAELRVEFAIEAEDLDRKERTLEAFMEGWREQTPPLRKEFDDAAVDGCKEGLRM